MFDGGLGFRFTTFWRGSGSARDCCRNGCGTGTVSHIIGGVIPPPPKLADELPGAVGFAQLVGDLFTLVAAVVVGDLVEALSSPVPFI